MRRQMISSLVLEGGFPPFLLQPINFDALFAEQHAARCGRRRARLVQQLIPMTMS